MTRATSGTRGGHEVRNASTHFGEAVRWLWRGWPEPVKAGAGSPQLQEIVEPGEGWRLAACGQRPLTGLAANAEGEVFYNDPSDGRIHKIGLDGAASPFSHGRPHGRGLAWGPDGRLYLTAARGGIMIYDRTGRRVEILAEGLPGEDLIMAHNGNLYVTGREGGKGRLWLIRPGGKPHAVDKDLKSPTGLALSTDQWLLRVSERESGAILSYQLRPDGVPVHKQRFDYVWAAEGRGAAGLGMDREGRLYAATRLGIQIGDPLGRAMAILTVPEGEPRSLCFGGEDFQNLYVTCGTEIYRRTLKVRGAAAFDEPFQAPPSWLP